MSRKHCCLENDCQIYPDNTRRRNPYPGEPNGAEEIALLREADEYSKENIYCPSLTEKL